MKTKAVILARVSSMQQDEKRQVSDLVKIANSKNYEVVDIITEKISGAKLNKDREGVQRLLDGARKGYFTKLLVTEVSRIGRSTMETLKLIDELHQLGVSIFLQDLNIETLDEKGEVNFQTELMVHMLSLFAKNERRNTIDRIRSGMEQAKKNGVHCGRPKGLTDSKEELLNRYSKVTDGLKRGFSVRECVKLYSVSLGTVAKLRSLIKEDLEMLQVA